MGTYSPLKGLASASECWRCPRGHFCEGVGLASPSGECYGGYICTGGSKIPNPINSWGYECQLGFYCEPGAPKEIACPPGTFAPSGGLSSLSQCQACPPGHYCPKFAMQPD